MTRPAGPSALTAAGFMVPVQGGWKMNEPSYHRNACSACLRRLRWR
jgi:hypothetical protein